MAHVHYLTVQDMLWIHFELTRSVEPYQYNLLEDGVFFQYAYGKSVDVPGQAGRLLAGFAAKEPFREGNAAAAFVAMVAFLTLNGYEYLMSDDEAHGWVERQFGKTSAEDSLRPHVRESHVHGDDHEPSVREAVMAAIQRYPKTIHGLLNRVAA